MSILQKAFTTYKSEQGRGIYKNLSYRYIYENILVPYRDKEVVLVEIGIGYGGCLQMWKDYLGPKAKIYGIDEKDHLCYEEERIKCFIGNQEDRDFLRKVKESIPPIDILIDDGSHYPSDQIASFEELFLHINPHGIYICEDVHTSYRPLYNGGYKKQGTFIEYCKDIVDALHYTENGNIPINDILKGVYSITFYSALVVIKKVGQFDV